MVAATKSKSYKVGTIVVLPIDEIKLTFNIRQPENTQKVDDIFNDIKANGIQEILKINQDGLLVDGNRRYYCAKRIQEETGTPYKVRAEVLQLAEKDIPEYQYRTGKRKNYSAVEKNRAIYEYALLNPEVQDKDIAIKFDVSKAAVFYATKIIRASLNLKDLVQNDLITQNAAKDIVDFYLGGREIGSITDGQRKKIDSLCVRILPEIEKDKAFKLAKNEEFKPWTLRSINAFLASVNEQLITKQDSDKKPKAIKIDVVVGEMLKTLEFAPTGDGSFTVRGTVTKDLLETLQKAIAEAKQGTLKVETFTEVPESGSYWEIWTKHSSFDGIVFVQSSSVNYSTYDEHIDSVVIHTSVLAEQENAGKVLTLRKTEMNAVIKKLNDEGINVLRLNRGKVTDSKATEASVSETDADNDADVEANEQSPVDAQTITSVVVSEPVEKLFEAEALQTSSTTEPGDDDDDLGIDLTMLPNDTVDSITEGYSDDEMGELLEDLTENY